MFAIPSEVFQYSTLKRKRVLNFLQVQWRFSSRAVTEKYNGQASSVQLSLVAKFLNGQKFTCVTYLHATMQILLQIAALFAIQKLSRFWFLILRLIFSILTSRNKEGKRDPKTLKCDITSNYYIHVQMV